MNLLRARAALVLAALLLGGCGSSPRARSEASTLRSTLRDSSGSGALTPEPGEKLRMRTDLGPAVRVVAPLARLAQISDAHVRDEESPARVPFLDRLGEPFDSTFRPQEALTAQVLAATVGAVNAARPQAVVVSGDVADSAQSNEFDQALGVLRGGMVNPGSGTPGYVGVQARSNPDPFYYRPDLDPPRHPGLLEAAQRPFRSPGLRAPWYAVAGNHDLLVQGEVAPRAATEQVATGARALYEPPPGIRLPRGRQAASRAVDALLAGGLPPGGVRVAADPARRELSAPEVLARLRGASGHGGTGPLLDYTFDVGPRVRGIVLDAVRRDAGSTGLIRPAQVAWLRRELARAGARWVMVFSHQPLNGSEGGDKALALLDRDPHVLAAVAGHTHRNLVVARHSPAGGYWLITTASLIDFPQQARMLQISETEGGGAVIDTWMLDHLPDTPLSATARALAFIDAQGGRPRHFAGSPLDRNVRLFKASRR